MVEEIFDAIKKSEIIEMACVVGSYNTKKQASNIDIIIISKTRREQVEKMLKLLFKQEPKISDDVIQYSINKLVFSFLISTKSQFESKLNKIVNGENFVPRMCDWAIGGWLPESFLNDLKGMLILKDNKNFLANKKNMLFEYPQNLKKAIIKFSDKKIELLESKLKYCEDNLIYKIIEGEIILHKIRKKYAENSVYLHSFSEINKEMING